MDLDTLLIINGCADRLTMWPTYVKMASDNTYGIKAINDSQVQEMEDASDMPGECRDKVMNCHEVAHIGDPKNLGDNSTVNAICENSEIFCYSYIMNGSVMPLAEATSTLERSTDLLRSSIRRSSISLACRKPLAYL